MSIQGKRRVRRNIVMVIVGSSMLIGVVGCGTGTEVPPGSPAITVSPTPSSHPSKPLTPPYSPQSDPSSSLPPPGWTQAMQHAKTRVNPTFQVVPGASVPPPPGQNLSDHGQ